MLDGVNTFFYGDTRAFEALRMRGDPVAEAVSLVHHGADLPAGELGALRPLQDHAAGARSHDLDEVRARLQLFPGGLPHLEGAVGGAVHGAEDAAAGASGGDDPSARQDARTRAEPVAYGLPEVQRVVAFAADVADREHAHRNEVAGEIGELEVAQGGRPGFLAPQGRRGASGRKRGARERPRVPA